MHSYIEHTLKPNVILLFGVIFKLENGTFILSILFNQTPLNRAFIVSSVDISSYFELLPHQLHPLHQRSYKSKLMSLASTKNQKIKIAGS